MFSLLVKPEGTLLLTTSTKAVHQVDSVTLTCNFTNSIPSPSLYRFYHKNKLVQETSNNTYIMDPVKIDDQGAYTCYPVNVVGRGSKDIIDLDIEGTILRLFSLAVSLTYFIGL